LPPAAPVTASDVSSGFRTAIGAQEARVHTASCTASCLHDELDVSISALLIRGQLHSKDDVSFLTQNLKSDFIHHVWLSRHCIFFETKQFVGWRSARRKLRFLGNEKIINAKIANGVDFLVS